MKTQFLGGLIAAVGLLSTAASSPLTSHGKPKHIKDRYIVVLKDQENSGMVSTLGKCWRAAGA